MAAARLTQIVIASLLLAIVPVARAAVPSTTFTHIGAKDGLPGQGIRALAQDGDGYIWFGTTTSGLARFDGLTMTVYRHEPDKPGSLPSDSINSLFTDRAGRLWVGTDEGLCRFVANTSTFDCVSPARTDGAKLISGMDEAPDGSLWVGGEGLHHVNPDTGEMTQWVYVGESVPDKPLGHETKYVPNVLVDSQGRIWVASYDFGLLKFDSKSATFERVPLGSLPGEKKTFMDDETWAVYEDRVHDLWVGSSTGLTRLSSDGRVEAFYTYNYENPADPRSLSDARVNVVREDSSGNLWVGTSTGLHRYERSTDTFRRYQLDPNDTRTIDTVGPVAILQDNSGLLWFGGRGVDRLDLSSEQILRHMPPVQHPALPVARRPDQLAIDKAGIVWLGNFSGLVRYDPKTDVWSHHLALPEHPDYPNNFIYAIHAGQGHARYLGMPQSMRAFNEPSGNFGPVIAAEDTPTAICEDSSGRIWVGLAFRGIGLFNPTAGTVETRFRLDAADAETLSGGFILFLYEDTSGRFWAGTEHGLDLLDRKAARVHRYGRDAGGTNYADDVFKAIGEGSNGDLWLATPHGLVRFNPTTGISERFGTKDGLAHGSVNAIAIDTSGNIWAGTEGGLSRFDPEARAFRNFYVENGLPDNEVLRLAMAPDGELFIATYRGLVSLDPAQFAAPAPAPSVAVSRFEIDGAPAFLRGKPDSFSGGTQQNVTLHHTDDIVSFELAVLDYRDPARNRYAYQLTGIDPEWVYAEGADRRATYTTLPAGDYVFHYKGVGTSGRWNEDAQPIALKVLPPPWATTWAYLIYAVLLMAAVAIVVHFRTRAANQRAAVLETTVAERTHELQQQKETIERQSERLQHVAEAKDRLYANVSHEFRTPLTVILGPVERLLAQEDSPRRRTHLEIIKRNAQRLLRLVEQLMSLARIDAQRTSHPNPLQIVRLARTLVNSFETLADDKNIELSFSSAGDPWIACDADSLEKIIVNLVSNAIKYSRAGGSIAVTVAAESPGWVDLTVADTGVGIPKQDMDKVFERFYRVGDHQETAVGTGLGLSLVKELVEAFGGTVTLSSEVGVGTTVRVALQQCEPPSTAVVDTSIQKDGSAVLDLEIATLELEDAIENLQQEVKSMPTALVIEDNSDLCWHLGEVLAGQARCEFAHDGEAGVLAAFETIPDIILCDVVLPKLNGFEVTRRIKEDERTCHIPVIMLTARSDEESRIHGLQSLADEYITKPFNEAELRQRIETLLSIREILRQRFARDSRRLSLDELPAEMGARDRRFLERLAQVVEAHYADPDFSMTEFTSLMAMSERQLQRKMKALTNSLPREYLRGYRLEKAAELLKVGEPAGSVAFAVGFSSQSYFTSCFKAQYGITPGAVGSLPGSLSQKDTS